MWRFARAISVSSLVQNSLIWFGSFCALTTPMTAQSLDLAKAKTVATFYFANHSFNLIAEDGWLVFPDSQSDTMMVRDLTGSRSDRDFSLAINRPTYVASMGGGRYVLSDAYDNTVAGVDINQRTQFSKMQYTNTFGPLHLAYYKGVIYGANAGDRLITRVNAQNFRAQSDYKAGSGPAFLHADHDVLFVAEVGAFSSPGDDFIVWYDLKTGKLAGRKELVGAVGEMAPWNQSGVCLTLRFALSIQCGYPDRDEWFEAETGTDPWGVVTIADQVWVLTRGEDGFEKAGVTLYTFDSALGKLTRGQTFDLTQIPGLKLPRSLAYDKLSNQLLVRGLESIVAIPVIAD